jgi:hypothetical protein
LAGHRHSETRTDPETIPIGPLYRKRHLTDSSSIAVATISWARSRDEEPVLERSLRRLSETGLPIVVADRGTNAHFTERLRGLNKDLQIVVPAEQGLVRQAQAAVAAAARLATPFILYVEPDKEEFFAARLMGFLQRAPAEHGIGVVLASRSTSALATFPPLQQYTERVFNDLCGEVTGTPGDYCYGPFLLHRALVPHVLRAKPALGWGWRPSTFVAAHRQALRIVHLVDEHTCAVDQRQENYAERQHRIRQLSENLLGLLT